MHKSFVKLMALAAAILATVTSLPPALAQGLTTSAVSGVVTNKDGQPVSGAAVTILHVPSGTRANTTTRANGQYDMSGLRVGGPYTVSATAAGLTPESITEVYLDLGQATSVNIALSSDVVQLDTFTVRSSRDTTFGSGRVSTGSNFGEDEIGNVATVRRNVQDIARLDSRVFLGSLDQGGQLSAQGQNFRYNSFLIDGVQANDPFGLNSNGFTSLRSPIPPEALQALSVELTPYDVRRTGFSGALINAVTKSGTNDFRGSVYYEFTDEDRRAKNPVSGVKDPFDEKTWGATFGGPIIPNKLFFFLSYDDFSRLTTAPNQNLIIPGNSQQITDIRTRAQTFNYDIGSFDVAENETYQETSIAKLDWNISDNHRLALSYRKTDGSDTVFSSFSGSTTTSFSSYWYAQPRLTENYVLQLNSDWTPNFRTDLSISYSDYDGSPRPNSSPFPEVIINGISGTRADNNTAVTNGQVRFGTEFSRQYNNIMTKTLTTTASGEYSVGNHTIVGGFDWENREIFNAFVQAWQGQFTFTNVAAWQSGTGSLLRALLAPGATPADVAADFDIGMFGVFLQDSWRVNDRLTLNAGLRFEQLVMPDELTAIPNANIYSEAAFRSKTWVTGQSGLSSTTLPDGNYTIAPRFSFNYELPTTTKTQIRGGIGLFQGRNPGVWLSNAYSNRGTFARQTVANATFAPNQIPTTYVPVAVNDPFSPTTAANLRALPVINVTDPDFKQPLTWKGNLAIDHQIIGGMIATLEAGYSQTDRMPFVTNLNLRKVGTNPDGRDRYAGVITNSTSASRGSSASNPYTAATFYMNQEFSDVYYLTNSKKGGGFDFTLKVTKPWKNNWFASLALTHSDYEDVGPMTSSVAQSNYNGRAVFNPNEDVAATSNYNIKNKVVLVLTRRFEFIKRAPTTITAIYEGRTGRPYSWVFRGDANGDGFTFNDLLYVPTDINDPKVRYASDAARDQFWAFVNSNTLNRYKGQVVPRNSETSPWVNTVDLKITQELPIYKRLRSELFLNVINFANLIDDSWGIQEEVPFSYRRAVVGTTYDAAANGGAGQYVYQVTTPDGVPVTANDTPVSRWQIQAGIRIKF